MSIDRYGCGMKAQLVLYDEDCGVCTMIAGWLERRGIAIGAIGSHHGERWLHDLTPIERYSSVHAIDWREGRHSAGAAIPVILRALPGGQAVAPIAAAFPRLTQALYARFAHHRYGISTLLGQQACAGPRTIR